MPGQAPSAAPTEVPAETLAEESIGSWVGHVQEFLEQLRGSRQWLWERKKREKRQADAQREASGRARRRGILRAGILPRTSTVSSRSIARS